MVELKKLVPNCFDKEKYTLHYENLQLYLRLGSKLIKIHCVLNSINRKAKPQFFELPRDQQSSSKNWVLEKLNYILTPSF